MKTKVKSDKKSDLSLAMGTATFLFFSKGNMSGNKEIDKDFYLRFMMDFLSKETPLLSERFLMNLIHSSKVFDSFYTNLLKKKTSKKCKQTKTSKTSKSGRS